MFGSVSDPYLENVGSGSVFLKMYKIPDLKFLLNNVGFNFLSRYVLSKVIIKQYYLSYIDFYIERKKRVRFIRSDPDLFFSCWSDLDPGQVQPYLNP